MLALLLLRTSMKMQANTSPLRHAIACFTERLGTDWKTNELRVFVAVHCWQ
jgi:hypothetical protein